ncbi:hypothetical protein BDR05DRAFT_152690 [Suillus weaverae]|nr:hypothetical protein BDR05DRAFT_152690 [Suillus weaverae]
MRSTLTATWRLGAEPAQPTVTTRCYNSRFCITAATIIISGGTTSVVPRLDIITIMLSTVLSGLLSWSSACTKEDLLVTV